MENKHKYVAVIVGVLVLVLGGIAYLNTHKKSSPNPTQEDKQETRIEAKVPEVKNLPTSQTPEGFLENFYIAPNTRVLKSFNADNDRSLQATRSYLASEPAQTIFKNYQDYLKTEKWQISSLSDTPEAKTLIAKKDNVTFTLGVYTSGTGKNIRTTFDLNFITKR